MRKKTISFVLVLGLICGTMFGSYNNVNAGCNHKTQITGLYDVTLWFETHNVIRYDNGVKLEQSCRITHSENKYVTQCANCGYKLSYFGVPNPDIHSLCGM